MGLLGAFKSVDAALEWPDGTPGAWRMAHGDDPRVGEGVNRSAGSVVTARSQQMRTDASRTKILDAAVRCLAEHGYAGTSTLKIQEIAGVSRGRLLHHFRSRDQLLVAAVHHLAAGRLGALRSEASVVVTAAPRDPMRIRQAVGRMWADFHQPHFWAEIELWIAARHSTGLRSALGPSEKVLDRSIYETVDAHFGPVFAARTPYPQVREILLSCMRGTLLVYSFRERDPLQDAHLDLWTRVAADLLLPDPS